MASLMESLIAVLDKESLEYEGLLELSMQKTPIIIEGDLKKLQEITDEEQEMVSRINNLDKTRMEITVDIANVLNRDVADLKLPNLIKMLEGRPVEQKLLASAHDRLQKAVRSLQKVNEQNKELIANALELVEFDRKLIQAMKTAPETANYNKGAFSEGSVMGMSGSGFDAKQ